MKRFCLLLALALALTLPGRAILAAPVSLALSDTAAQDSPEALADAYFAQLVEERTDGRVRIELHLDGALYADDVLAVQALILGDAAFARVPADAAAAFSPGLYVLQMPGLYADDAHMTAALADARAGGLALDAMRPAGLIGLCVRALTVLPDEAVRVFAELAGLDEKALRDDPGVGLDGLLEMIEAWLEVNNLENFIRAARALWQRARAGRTNGGSNG